MHLVNIQRDNAPERVLHLTGEEESGISDAPMASTRFVFCPTYCLTFFAAFWLTANLIIRLVIAASDSKLVNKVSLKTLKK